MTHTPEKTLLSVDAFLSSRPKLAQDKVTMLRYLETVSDSIAIEPCRVHCEFDCGAYKGSEILTFHMKTINPFMVALSLMNLTSGHHFSYDRAEKVLLEMMQERIAK